MSWWDTSSISSLASQALKNAQKKIDKVLDIEADSKGEHSRKNTDASKKKREDPKSENADSKEETGGEEGKDFWYTWMGKDENVSNKYASAASPPQSSSWGLPWGTPPADTESPTVKTKPSTVSSAERRAAARALLSSKRKETSKSKSATSPVRETLQEDTPLPHPTIESDSNKQSEPSHLHSQSDTPDDNIDPSVSHTHSELDSHKDVEDASTVTHSKSHPVNAMDPSEHSLSQSEVDLQKGTEQLPSEEGDLQHQNEAEQEVSVSDSSSNLQNAPLDGNISLGNDCESKNKTVEEQTPHEVEQESSPEAESPDNMPQLAVDLDKKNCDHENINEAAVDNSGCELSGESGWNDADNELVIDDSQINSNIYTEHFSHDTSSHPADTDFKDNRDNEVSQAEHESNGHKSTDLDNMDPQSDELLHNSSEPTEDTTVLPCDLAELNNANSDSNAPASEQSDKMEDVDEVSATNIETGDCAISSDDKSNFQTLSKPDFGEGSISGSSDMSLVGYPDSAVEESTESLQLADGSVGEKSLSQEFVQIISLNSSAISSDDCLKSSSDLDPYAASTNDLDPSDVSASDLAHSMESSDVSQLDSSADTVVENKDRQDDEGACADHGYSLFGESGSETESKPLDNDVDGSNTENNNDEAQGSPNSSDVKSLIQDAMDDMSNKTEDSGSDNYSLCEAKSDGSKVDSEMEKSVYSGHESSDDIETTTSSDIEILSAPHSNGEAGPTGHMTKFDFSTMQAQQRTLDSSSASSTNSKVGDVERLSPERGENTDWKDEDFLNHGLEAVKEEDPENPYHPERLLKLAQAALQQELRGGKKLAEMAEVLQARESKLIQLSKENHSLMEDANILRCQLKQAEEAREAEAADLDALTQEFTLRIGEAEKKMQTVLKEKEKLKQQLASAEKELTRRSADTDLEALLEEKRQQVDELMLEGEKLSKQQLQSSNIIKKLRAKEKESDATIASQRKKLEDQSAELEHLKMVLNSKEDMEKKQNEAIGQLNSAVQRQEKEIGKLRSDLEDAQEKSRGLQVALDNSYKEIAELHKSNAVQDSKAQEAALSAETHVREELKAAMEREQIKFRQEREAFIMQADDLRLDMARLEKEHNRREDVLRQEIAHLQARLQEDEARSQELTQSVSTATRPLLRQIENLQATYGAQSNAWERVEKNLTDRLAEAQTSLAVIQEKERTSSQRYMDLQARVAALEAANSTLRQEKATLTAQIEGDKSRLEEMQDSRNSVVAQLESSKKVLSEELAQLKLDKVHLESQLSAERSRVDAEKKKSSHLEEQLRIAERPRSRGSPSPSPSMSVSRQESVAGSVHEGFGGGIMNWSFNDESDSGSTVGVGGSRTSVYDSLRQSGAAIVVENMSSQLKLREGEITQLQSEISQLERTRESMARELVNLSNKNDELEEMRGEHEALQAQFKELNQRYSAILQMYGEKEEQVQELRLDLQDVKEMYKTQIDALLTK